MKDKWKIKLEGMYNASPYKACEDELRKIVNNFYKEQQPDNKKAVDSITELFQKRGYQCLSKNIVLFIPSAELVINRSWMVLNVKDSFKTYFQNIHKHDAWIIEAITPILNECKIQKIGFADGDISEKIFYTI